MEVPAGVWLQYPVAAIIVGLVIYLLGRFEKFIEKQNQNWQAFLKERDEEFKKNDLVEQETIKSMVGEILRLTNELVKFRQDFDIAVAQMRERTQTRARRKPVKEAE